MRFDENFLFKLSIALFLASLILPANGHWFAGVGLFVVSAIGALVIIFGGGSGVVSEPKDLLSLFMLLMPSYNFLFVIGLMRFRVLREKRFSVFNILLYACTVVALIWGSMGLFHRPELFYVLFLWAGGFLSLSAAIMLKTEKNLTSR